MGSDLSKELLSDVDLSLDAPARTVGQIVSGPLLSCGLGTPLWEAASLMHAAHCSSVIVTDEGKPVGIWTERDALGLDFTDCGMFDRPISAFMTAGIKIIRDTDTISSAGLRFKRDRIRHLLVVDAQGKPAGMLSQTDVVLNHGVEHYLTFRDVRSVMSPNVPILSADMSLTEAARQIRDSACDAAVVTSPDWADIGIVTERDIVRMAATRRSGTVGQAASRPAIAVAPNATLLVARNLFAQHNFRHLVVRDQTGDVVGLISFGDILDTLQYEYVAQINSALRERDLALIRSRKDLHLARQVIQAAHDGVMVVDENGLIEYVNPAFTRVTGYSAAEAIGQSPRLLKSGRQDADFYQKMWAELTEAGHWQGEIWNRRKDGQMFTEWLTINCIRDDDGRILKYAAIFSDITHKKQDEERVRTMAYTDPLTSLPNRRLLTDRLELAIAQAHRHGLMLAVLFLDLDLFKRINDTLGHDVGDAVLVEMTQRLVGCVREGDTVARVGGDEFVILLPEVEDASDLAPLAERIIAAVQAPMHVADHEFYLTTSIGIAVYPEDGTKADALLKCADQAMYQAKESGRNGYHLFSPAMNARSAKRLDMDHRLRTALANDEIHLVYQVKVDMLSGTVCGAEALARWHNADLGTVPPNDFIPLAERIGVMPELGVWVLRSACRQAKSWIDDGLPPVPVAVNLSSRQFLRGDLAVIVERTLAETGLPAQLLEVELTESTITGHPTEVQAELGRLHELGVRIAIDDFGTHPTSMMALSRLPIDALKIDRGFIDGLGDCFGQRDIVGAIIHLAHALGMRAVAEGVERPRQVELLRAAECDVIQGYLIGRPLFPADLRSLFARRLLPVG